MAHRIEIGEKVFFAEKFTAIEGRRIIANYPISALPRVGDYDKNEEVMLELMKFVSVDVGGTTIPLVTRDLVNNHVDGWDMLVKLEWEVMKLNCPFLQDGSLNTFVNVITTRVTDALTKCVDDAFGRMVDGDGD